MILFYGNTVVLIPKLLSKKRVFYYLVSIAILITLISFVSGYLQVFLNPEYSKKPELYSIAFNTAIIVSILTWFISSAFKVTTEWLRNQQQMRIIENEKLITELNFLKSQVNPHFLFNALNNIYALEVRKSSYTGEAILKLSELIRYMLYETSPEQVPLESEVAYLKNYIDLQKLSMTEQIQVVFETKGDFNGRKIEPMLLIALVENVFKHGISYKGPCCLKITITLEKHSLILHTENPLFENKANNHSTGIGLSNLKKRLELLYLDRHSLKVENKDGIFVTDLNIQVR
jgi:LytS/YehU family sensor histidine kinase